MPVPKLNRPPHPKPLVLVATSNVGHRHELAHMLSHAGFRVGSARDEPELLHQAHTEPPDAIVVDAEIAPPGYGLCGTLRTFALATPIVLTVAGGVTRSKEHEALRATRHGLALACAVFRPATQLPNHAAVDRLALAFKSAGRASDALGRTGRAEFAVFAPARNGTSRAPGAPHERQRGTRLRHPARRPRARRCALRLQHGARGSPDFPTDAARPRAQRARGFGVELLTRPPSRA